MVLPMLNVSEKGELGGERLAHWDPPAFGDGHVEPLLKHTPFKAH
jgi:hypothetical protein